MLSLVIAPDPIYRTPCSEVAQVDDAIRATLDAMMATCIAYDAMGMGAPMVGITQRLVVIHMDDEAGTPHHYKMVNPVISAHSAKTGTMEEGSLTFLGISAPVTRPSEVTVDFLDEQGEARTLQASGLLAVCVQHEIDYLNGKTFLDHQPPVKRDMLRRKMEKQKRNGPLPHIHGPDCHH